MPLSEQDAEYVRLFKWVIVAIGASRRKPVPPEEQIPLLVREKLSVEGVISLGVDHAKMKRVLYNTLRKFRRLNQHDRLQLARRLWKEWSE